MACWHRSSNAIGEIPRTPTLRRPFLSARSATRSGNGASTNRDVDTNPPQDATCNPSFDDLHSFVIRSFKSKKLKRLFEADDAAGLPSEQAEKIADILAALDTAEQPADVALFPGWRLHPLKGEWKGVWSVTITGNWRLVFRFEDGDALDVDLVDYH
jgi:toxin HigB-1